MSPESFGRSVPSFAIASVESGQESNTRATVGTGRRSSSRRKSRSWIVFSEKENTLIWCLAGNPRIVARVRDSLPKRLKEKLVDIVPVSGSASTVDVVSATLSTFVEHEETESVETASLFLDELKTGGLAVAGTEATLKALAQAQVDVLVVSESYAAPDGWKCSSCGTVGVNTTPKGCPQCGERTVAPLNLKEHITSTAERFGSTVEVVRNSDVLLEVGGVGCLLRYVTPEQRAAAAD